MNNLVHSVSSDPRIVEQTFDSVLIIGRSKNYTNFAPFVYQHYLKESWNVGKDFTGQWWFVLHDNTSGRVRLIRDKFAYTSLFFTIINQELYVSEDINDILKLRKFKINVEAIALSMLLNVAEAEAGTYFEGIYSLPAGYQMMLEKQKVTISRYWFPENTPSLSYKHHDHYVQEFGELFKKSVESSFKEYSTIASTLSGGLDSSSVTCLAARYLSQTNQSIHSFTHLPAFPDSTFDMKGKFGNEQDHVHEILKQYPNIKGEYVRSNNVSPIAGLKKIVEITGGLIHGAANAYWLYDIYNKVAQGKFEVLLTGENGNATISYTGNRLLLNWRHDYYKQNFRRLLIDQAYRPLRNYFSSPSDSRYDQGFHFLNDVAIDELGLRQHYLSEAFLKNEKDENPINSNKLMMLDASRRGRMPFGGQLANHFGFDMIDPTGSEELIEYTFSLPNDVYFGEKGTDKFLIRKLMRGILPEKVRLESRVGQQSSDVGLRLKQTTTEVDATLNLVSKNPLFTYLFDVPALHAFWSRMQLSPQQTHLYDINSFLKVLMAVILIEKHK